VEDGDSTVLFGVEVAIRLPLGDGSTRISVYTQYVLKTVDTQ